MNALIKFAWPFIFFSHLAMAKPIPHLMGDISPVEKTDRILALEYSFVDALLTLGVRPMGIADDGDKSRLLPWYGESLKNWVGLGTRKQPHLKTMAKLGPDLILADGKRHRGAYPQFKSLAPTAVLPSLGEDFPSNLNSFLTISKILGKEELGKKKLSEFKDVIFKSKMNFNSLKKKKVLFAVSWEKGFHIHTSKAYVPGLLKELGFNYLNMPSNFSKASEKIGLETLLHLNPDVLILARRKTPILVDEWMKSPLWKELEISKKGKLIVVDQNLWTRLRGITASYAIIDDLKQKINL
jgi:ABC-type Fe3+-citrate transport system substrate-binding protein